MVSVNGEALRTLGELHVKVKYTRCAYYPVKVADFLNASSRYR